MEVRLAAILSVAKDLAVCPKVPNANDVPIAPRDF